MDSGFTKTTFLVMEKTRKVECMVIQILNRTQGNNIRTLYHVCVANQTFVNICFVMKQFPCEMLQFPCDGGCVCVGYSQINSCKQNHMTFVNYLHSTPYMHLSKLSHPILPHLDAPLLHQKRLYKKAMHVLQKKPLLHIFQKHANKSLDWEKDKRETKKKITALTTPHQLHDKA